MEEFIIGRAINGRAFVISKVDADLLSLKWRTAPRGRTIYLQGSGVPYEGKLLHRIILERAGMLKITKGLEVDHCNGCGLDNRRLNLRVASRQQNNANQFKSSGTSRFKGVCWDSERERWLAQIKVNGQTQFLGRFENEEEAARAYDLAAIKAFGDFARINGSSN